jgi:hypothetical protein
MVGVALRQTMQPLLRIPGAVVVGDNGVKGTILLAFEADVVTGTTNELSLDNDLCRLRTHVALVAIEVLGRLMDFYLREPHVH